MGFIGLIHRIFDGTDDNYRLLESRLRITSLSPTHSGIYSCEGESDVGIAKSNKTFLLNVRGEGGLSAIPVF